MSWVMEFVSAMPPLRRERSPQAAATVGFLFGGIGLGIYCRSFIDFALPILAAILISVVAGGVAEDYWIGLVLSSAVVAVYGYFRVMTSNTKLQGVATVAGAPAGAQR